MSERVQRDPPRTSKAHASIEITFYE